ncbi:DNA polymerase III subunit gamma/tau [Candidatus Latescibacterota bacterium]
MSYIVTARKWRPQFFRDVIGQNHVTETLKSAIKSNQVGHAYLFSGPRGVGKTTVARIFAKALNCEHGPSEEPCNTCSICQSIQVGTSMDIQELDGASHNSVNDVRDLIVNIGYHSSECRYKMYIIDEVHMLSKEAFNALLKTLEEPPPNVIFVFATTEPQKLPPTILSRCQRYDFHRLSVHDIAVKLRTITETDGVRIDDSSIMLIARRATGAMRDAESILEQLKASRGVKITVSDVNDVLGIADREVFFRVIEECHENNARGTVEIFNSYFDEGGDLKEFIEGMLGHLRDLLYVRFEGGLEHVILSEDLKTRLKNQSEWFEQNDIIRMIGFITDVETSLSYAVMPVLRIEVALARMATMETTIQLKDLFEKIGEASKQKISVETFPDAGIQDKSRTDLKTTEKIEEIPVDKTVSKNKVSGVTELLNISPDIESISKSWKEIASRVSTVKPAIGPSLTLAVPESFKNEKLTLGFNADDEFHMKTIESNSNKIEEIIGAFLGTKVKLKCLIRRTDVEKKKNSEIDDLIAREPIIGNIIECFDSEINESWRE